MSKGMWLKLLGIVFDVVNIVIIVFSVIDQPANKGIIQLLAVLAIIVFTSIFGVEYFRKRKIEILENEKPPLNSDQIYFKAMSPTNKNAQRVLDMDVIEWEQEQQKVIKKANGRCLGLEVTLFILGIAFMVIIALYYFVS